MARGQERGRVSVPPRMMIVDPDDLTGREREEVERLLTLPAEDFDRIVFAHALNPTEASQRIFSCSDLAQAAVDALDRLRAPLAQQIAEAPPGNKEPLDIRLRFVNAERRRLRPFVNLALVKAAQRSPRKTAEAILGRVFYHRYLAGVIRDLRNGMTAEEAEQRLRQRITPGERDY